MHLFHCAPNPKINQRGQHSSSSVSTPDRKHPAQVYTQLSTQTHINGASHESQGLEKCTQTAQRGGDKDTTCVFGATNGRRGGRNGSWSDEKTSVWASDGRGRRGSHHCSTSNHPSTPELQEQSTLVHVSAGAFKAPTPQAGIQARIS